MYIRKNIVFNISINKLKFIFNLLKLKANQLCAFNVNNFKLKFDIVSNQN